MLLRNPLFSPQTESLNHPYTYTRSCPRSQTAFAMSRQGRILLALGAAVVSAGTYVYLFGPQTMFAVLARWKYQQIRETMETPVPLRDTTISAVPHTADSGLFSVRAAGLEGFRYGNPEKAPNRVGDDLYAQDGGVEFIFFKTRTAPCQLFRSRKSTGSFKA